MSDIPSFDWGKVKLLDGKYYFQYDHEDLDGKEQWEEYCETTAMLRNAGWEWDGESYSEHDCLSGDIKKILDT